MKTKNSASTRSYQFADVMFWQRRPRRKHFEPRSGRVDITRWDASLNKKSVDKAADSGPFDHIQVTRAESGDRPISVATYRALRSYV
ncbi:hypothetical protein RRG08_028920 [Elysia crispata]|uniref:Uncharacterized protein n=1 Tax=Elysia crispata TaxID=231223 RepID=A0AAE1AS61_9GAST|nr:hypothetical protein RRG08_028920 [Elysia crispata]